MAARTLPRLVEKGGGLLESAALKTFVSFCLVVDMAYIQPVNGGEPLCDK